MYSDFEDLTGAEIEVELPGFDSADFEQFRRKDFSPSGVEGVFKPPETYLGCWGH